MQVPSWTGQEEVQGGPAWDPSLAPAAPGPPFMWFAFSGPEPDEPQSSKTSEKRKQEGETGPGHLGMSQSGALCLYLSIKGSGSLEREGHLYPPWSWQRGRVSQHERDRPSLWQKNVILAHLANFCGFSSQEHKCHVFSVLNSQDLICLKFFMRWSFPGFQFLCLEFCRCLVL